MIKAKRLARSPKPTAETTRTGKWDQYRTARLVNKKQNSRSCERPVSLSHLREESEMNLSLSPALRTRPQAD